MRRDTSTLDAVLGIYSILSVMRYSRSLAVLLLSLGGIACSNGSSSTTDPQDPYAEDFANAEKAAVSDFQRVALSDGIISRTEYEEAVNGLIQCLKDAGVSAKANRDAAGFYTYEIIGIHDLEMDTCQRPWTQFIEPLYVDPLRNPNKVDPIELKVACLQRHDLVTADYTADDFRLHGGPTPDFPLDTDAPEFVACVTNPLG